MVGLKVKMLYDDTDGEDGFSELYFKTQFIDGDKISSFYVDNPVKVQGEDEKCFAIVCDGQFFSIKREDHIYQFLFDRFMRSAIQENNRKKLKK